MRNLSRFTEDQSGLASIEYALLLALIGVVVALAMAALGQAVTDRMDATTSEMSG